MVSTHLRIYLKNNESKEKSNRLQNIKHDAVNLKLSILFGRAVLLRAIARISCRYGRHSLRGLSSERSAGLFTIQHGSVPAPGGTRTDGHVSERERYEIHDLLESGGYVATARTAQRGCRIQGESVIGSGNHACGYVIRLGDNLFQSPIGYYADRHGYDMAPGYEKVENPDFTRPVSQECLLPHRESRCMSRGP